MKEHVNGILLFYHHPIEANAPTILEHVRSFGQYSRFSCLSINSLLPFPPSLYQYEFSVVIFHYSLFGKYIPLDSSYLKYLKQAKPQFKIGFFQDDYHNCPQRFAFINEHSLDLAYTLLDKKYHRQTYLDHSRVCRVRESLAGYVSEDLVRFANRNSMPPEERGLDIGYRARQCAVNLGRAAREKYWIAVEFEKRARPLGLTLDINTNEHDRIYGEEWFQFMANCRGTLGAEAGVSMFDIDGSIEKEHDRIIKENPRISDEVLAQHLDRYDNNIPYRVLSPRVFEAAALRVCQIMFPGHYNGIIEPMVHYLPVRRDFGNFDWVIRNFRDPKVVRTLTENAYRDLIASGRYSYARLIEGVDKDIEAAGCVPDSSNGSRTLADELAQRVQHEQHTLSVSPPIVQRTRRLAGKLPRQAMMVRYLGASLAKNRCGRHLITGWLRSLVRGMGGSPRQLLKDLLRLCLLHSIVKENELVRPLFDVKAHLEPETGCLQLISVATNNWFGMAGSEWNEIESALRNRQVDEIIWDHSRINEGCVSVNGVDIGFDATRRHSFRSLAGIARCYPESVIDALKPVLQLSHRTDHTCRHAA